MQPCRRCVCVGSAVRSRVASVGCGEVNAVIPVRVASAGAHSEVGIFSEIDFWSENGFSEKTTAEIEVLTTQSKAFVKLINDNRYYREAQTFAASQFKSFEMTFGVDSSKSAKVLLQKKLYEYTPSEFYWLSQFYLYSYDSFAYDQEEADMVKTALEKCMCEYAHDLAGMMGQ